MEIEIKNRCIFFSFFYYIFFVHLSIFGGTFRRKRVCSSSAAPSEYTRPKIERGKGREDGIASSPSFWWVLFILTENEERESRMGQGNLAEKYISLRENERLLFLDLEKKTFGEKM